MTATGGLELDLAARHEGFELALGLDVQPGETVALLGPNGAGKSTAIAAIAGLHPADGVVCLGGRTLDDASRGIRLPVESRRVGVVFQDSLLFPHLSVLENVAFGPRSVGIARADARRRAVEWLERMGIAELAARRPGGLSGGQAQRVALARALACEPDALLLDEPLSALDAAVRGEVRAELAGHLAQFAGPCLLVTHSLDDVRALAHRAVVLEGGLVTQRGTVEQLASHPATPYVRSLVADSAGDGRR